MLFKRNAKASQCGLQSKPYIYIVVLSLLILSLQLRYRVCVLQEGQCKSSFSAHHNVRIVQFSEQVWGGRKVSELPKYIACDLSDKPIRGVNPLHHFVIQLSIISFKQCLLSSRSETMVRKFVKYI